MKKILLVILGMFLLGFIFNEITGEKFPIGSTMLHDSTSVFTFNNNVKINGYMESKGRKIETGQVTKQKLIRGVLPSTTGGNSFFSHGITDYRKIVSINTAVRDDSLSWMIPQGYNGTTSLTVGNIIFVRSADIGYFFPSGSASLKSDTIFFWVTYTE